MTQQLLMIEDDTRLANMVGEYLRQSGYDFVHAATGAGGLEALQANAPNLVILDLMLPDMDGLEVCRRIKNQGGDASRTAVLMLTAKGDPMDRIVGLEIGADDYLPKPFDPRELLVRIKVVLRRAQSFPERARVDEAPFVRFDQWRLDTRARQVLSAEGLVISLGNSDYRVLRLLLQHPNRPLSRDFLLNHVFDKDSTPFDRSIDVCVSRLRQQLAPGLIKTVRNEGYMLTSACVTSES